jgi:hypothetical protein
MPKRLIGKNAVEAVNGTVRVWRRRRPAVAAYNVSRVVRLEELRGSRPAVVQTR